MKIMPVSDSPWAPTGFGTNTRNIASIFADEGHQVGYAGCQNTKYPNAQNRIKKIISNILTTISR